jgi:hypothetical protein
MGNLEGVGPLELKLARHLLSVEQADVAFRLLRFWCTALAPGSIEGSLKGCLFLR